MEIMGWEEPVSADRYFSEWERKAGGASPEGASSGRATGIYRRVGRWAVGVALALLLAAGLFMTAGVRGYLANGPGGVKAGLVVEWRDGSEWEFGVGWGARPPARAPAKMQLWEA